MHRLFIILGPSGIGKSFALNTILASFPDHFDCLNVYTTRPMRASETSVSDRVFVSKEEFERMVSNGQFSVHYHFAGNWYGYRKQDLIATGKHIITNAPPFTLPKFMQYDNLIPIGLQAPAHYSDFLRTRIEARGDSFSARKSFIEHDIQDLEAIKHHIDRRGKIFEVKDDSTIPIELLPWITEQLGYAYNDESAI